MTVAQEAGAVTAHNDPVHTRAVIIGSGFSGLGMAIALQKQGFGASDFVILEKADEIGGTWRDNTYPGCACDIPSHMYSFSFEPKPDWTHMWSLQPEIFDYLKGVADKYGLRRYVRFNSHVDRAQWDDAEMRWHVFTEGGQEYVAQFLVSGAGALHIPLIPDIEGRDDFAGVAFHSAQWDHSVGLTGKRIAVIGTGASAIQLVPAIVEDVAELQVYQRTPPWVMPRPNNALPQWLRRIFTDVPGTRALTRAAIYWLHEVVGFGMTKQPGLLRIGTLLGTWNIRRAVKDKALRRKLIPNYRAGCKRILNSDTYYRGIANPKTQVITEPIVRMTRDGIVTADGVEHAVDVLVFATGFHVTDSYSYVDIKGPGWRGPRLLVEPRGRRGAPRRHRRRHAQPVLPARPEHRPWPQLGGVHDRVPDPLRRRRPSPRSTGRAPRRWRRARAAQDRSNAELQGKLAGSVWNTGGCSSWYLDEHGVNRTLWSGMTWQYWRDTRSA